jgi:putative ATP-dependent endonuclease of the OLD family
VDSRPITAGQRAKLGFFRLGEDVDAHLRWGRSSALSALTESQSDAASVVLDAHRHARDAAFDLGNASLQRAADTVKRGAQELGARVYDTIRAGLDAVGSSSAGLVLHNDTIPLTREGLGTRRLTSLAIQNEAVEGGSIIAIDEVEYGLEPHRLVHLLHRLRVSAEARQIQVFLTTHSELTVTALMAQDLAVARSHGGVTTVSDVDGSLDNVQGTVRSAPAALLGRRIIVVEGSTEVGFVRQLCRYWETRNVEGRGQLTAATAGLAVANGGGGASAAQRAKVFVSLGYPCALVLDNDDRSVDSVATEAEAAGVTLIRWTDGRALEDEIVRELDDDGVRCFVEVAAESLGEESVRDRIADRLGVTRLIGLDPTNWRDDDRDDATIRTAIACAATGRSLNADGTLGEQETKRGWFKREDGGEELAHLVCAHGAALRGTHLADQLVRLRKFVYVKP